MGMKVMEQTGEKKPPRILVCVNHRFGGDQPSCSVRGSQKNAESLELGIRQRRINIEMERICCLSKCTEGPAMRLAPGGTFYLGVKLDDIPGILDELEKKYGTR